MRNNVTEMTVNRNATATQRFPSEVAPEDRNRQLAKAVALLIHLPEGDALVPLLGNGGERSNLEALDAWIKRRYAEVAERSFGNQVAALAGRLTTELYDLQSDLFD